MPRTDILDEGPESVARHIRKAKAEVERLGKSIRAARATEDRAGKEAELRDAQALHGHWIDRYKDQLDCVEQLASRSESPASFYNDQGDPLTGDMSNTQTTIIDKIRSVTPSNPDAVKEIERLLAHTTAKRIAEEMDVATYHAAASRHFNRLKQEAKDAKASIAKEIERIGPCEEAMAHFKALKQDEDKDLIEALGVSDTAELARHCDDAITFLPKYRNFLEFCRDGYDRMQRDFCHEATVEDFKDSTRQVADRVEQEGVFAAWRPILAGGAAAFLVGLVIVLLSNNVTLKDWTLPLMATAGLFVYGKSVGYGQTYRRDEIEALRSKIRQALNGFFVPRTAERSVLAASDEATAPFRFVKLAWGQKFATGGKEAREAKPVPIAPQDGLSRRNEMRAQNLRLIGLVCAGAASIALLLEMTWPQWDKLPWTRSFAFVTRGPGQTLCTLTTGRILFSLGDRASVHRGDGGFSAIRKADLVDLSVDADGAPRRCPGEPPQPGPAAAGADPVVVVPVIAAAGGTADPPRQANAQPSALTTQIFLAGQTVSREKMTVLPLFSQHPVNADSDIYDGGIDQPEEAFFYGQQDLPWEFRMGVERLLEPIRSQFIDCAEQRQSAYRDAGLATEPGKTRLRIEGYASEQWVGVEAESRRGILNLYLAEGRRRAIIRMLDLRHPLIEIENSVGDPAPLTAIPSAGSLKPEEFQFPSPEGLRKALGEWLKGLPAENVASTHEVLARSAAIRVIEEPSCGLSG